MTSIDVGFASIKTETLEQYAVGQEGTPGQGPFMLILVRVVADRITKASFSTYGCPSSAACGQFVTEQVQGKTLAEAEQMEVADILAGVGHMPLGREHCPPMTIAALRHALTQLRAENP